MVADAATAAEVAAQQVAAAQSAGPAAVEQARRVAQAADVAEAAAAGRAAAAPDGMPHFPLRMFQAGINYLRNPVFAARPAHSPFKKCRPEGWENDTKKGGEVGVGMADTSTHTYSRPGAIQFAPRVYAEARVVAEATADPGTMAGNHYLVMKGVACIWQEIVVIPGRQYMFAAVVAQGGGNAPGIANDFHASCVELQPNRDESEQIDVLQLSPQGVPGGWTMVTQAFPISFTTSTVQVILRTSVSPPVGYAQYECATVVERVGLFLMG